MILKNEILYADGVEIIYKTISACGRHYGMYSDSKGEIIKPQFLYIFCFDKGADTTVAIKKNEEYVALNLNGETGKLRADEEILYRSYLLKNNLCNCYHHKCSDADCDLCDGIQQIPNHYAMKLLDMLLGW